MKKINLILIIAALLGCLYGQEMTGQFSLKKSSSDTKPAPAGNSVSDIAFAPNEIWIVTNTGLSKSTDNGESWISFADNDLKENESVFYFDYNDGVLWVTMGHIEEVQGSNEFIGGGLIYSADGGETWTSIDQPLDAETDTTFIYGNNTLKAVPTYVKGNNVSFDVEYADGVLWIASWAGGLRKSSDMGQTWERVLLPPDYLDEINPGGTYSFEYNVKDIDNQKAFTVESIGQDSIVVGTANGINFSFDGGISWKKVNHQNQENGIIGNFVRYISYNPVDKSIWASCKFASGTGEKFGVSVSYDFGESWTNYFEEIEAYEIGFFGTDVLVPTKSKGLYRSSDNGSSWTEFGKIVDSQTNVPLNTLQYNIAKSNGNDIWIGSSRGLAKIEIDGDEKVYFSTGDSKQTYAFPNPYNPKNGLLNIKYFTTSENSEVTIRIFDFGMNLVKTVIQNAPRYNSGEKIDTWDGRDEGGNYVPNGVYFFRVDTGSGDPEFGKILFLR